MAISSEDRRATGLPARSRLKALFTGKRGQHSQSIEGVAPDQRDLSGVYSAAGSRQSGVLP